MSALEKKDIESQIEWLRSICGCNAGAAASMVSLAIYLLTILTSSLDDQLNLSARIGLGILIMFLGAVIGKTSAILYARIRIKQLLRKCSCNSSV